jgi:hypothetical protein
MMDNPERVDASPPKPSFRARLSILLIGGAAIAGIVLMCVLVLVIATRS